MNARIKWNGGNVTVDVPAAESDLWKEVGKQLPDMDIPNVIEVTTPYGNAVLNVTKRGTVMKNGIKMPSMYVVPKYNLITGLQQSAYPEAYLTCINPEGNNYKFYHLKPKTYGIDATYGRIGSERGERFGVTDLQTPYETYLYWIRYYEKLSKGYVDASDVYLTGDTINKTKQTQKKKKAVDPVSSELYQKLISYANHVVKTTLQNAAVTVEQVKKAKYYLNQMGKRKTVNGFNSQLQKLLMVSPRKTSNVSDFLAIKVSDFAGIIAREENLIAAMEAVTNYNSIQSSDEADDFHAMGIEVYYANDKQKQQVLSHLPSDLQSKIKNIYRVIPKKQQEKFDNYLKKNHIRNVKQLWHGSRNGNWFSILTNGLLLNPNAVITGKMFGKGIYFASSAKKSWNYTSYHNTYWAKGTDDIAFMGLYATAYGKPKDVTCSRQYTQKILDACGCNCVHAHAGQQLINDEIIYYNEDAMVCNYIVEFG